MKTLIGLTGGIACGKSTVSSIIRNLKIPVVDADQASRNVVKPYNPAWFALRAYFLFNKNIFNKDNTINREYLGKLIFSNKDVRKTVDKILTPFILIECARQIYLAFKKNNLVVFDAPLLIEKKLHIFCNKVIVVSCDLETQVTRLMYRNSLSRQEALNRINSQMPTEEKCKLAHYIIDNNGPDFFLESKVQIIIEDLNNHA